MCALCGSSQFCMTVHLFMLVEDARGNHIEEATIWKRHTLEPVS